jgi:hypothetical protein
MTRFEASSRRDHAAISSMVRRQPSHQPVAGSMRHTDTQGDGTPCTAAGTSGRTEGLPTIVESNEQAMVNSRIAPRSLTHGHDVGVSSESCEANAR